MDSSKKIILLPSGFSRHTLSLLVLHPNEYLGSMLPSCITSLIAIHLYKSYFLFVLLSILLRLITYLQLIILFFNKKDNFVDFMNYREDLEIKLQKVTLAMQEVVEDIYKTDQEKQRIINRLIDFKKAIISKGLELNIELEAA